MMHRVTDEYRRNRRAGRLAGVVTVAVLAAAPAARAQDRIDPAPTVRVVQSADPVTGEIARWVVENPAPAEILRVQVELARAGYDPAVRSGQLDGATRRALSDFQTARGLMICGCLTYETIVALGIRPQVSDLVSGGAGGSSGAGVGSSAVAYDAYDRYGQVIVIVPGSSHRRRHHAPGVVVGHEPAVGAGQLDQRPAPVSVGVREIRRPPPRQRTGGAIRLGPGTPRAPQSPRPPRPIPR